MNKTVDVSRQEFFLTGASGNRLAASRFPALKAQAQKVLLLHGGGQTRHAWTATCRKLAAAGFEAVAMDQRGHGDSAWIESGVYSVAGFAADAAAVSDQITGTGEARPVAIGASLGGLASLIALGARADVFAGLVLVDVAARMKAEGLVNVQNFMRAQAFEGFASVEEAGAAITRYLPHRPKPKSLAGLAKNLRLKPDGRYYWHWDPRFINRPASIGPTAKSIAEAVADAARSLSVPTLLVRGGDSELVGEEEVTHFRALCPSVEYADVANARHMVAGDENDAFGAAILGFLKGHFGEVRA